MLNEATKVTALVWGKSFLCCVRGRAVLVQGGREKGCPFVPAPFSAGDPVQVTAMRFGGHWESLCQVLSMPVPKLPLIYIW